MLKPAGTEPCGQVLKFNVAKVARCAVVYSHDTGLLEMILKWGVG